VKAQVQRWGDARGCRPPGWLPERSGAGGGGAARSLPRSPAAAAVRGPGRLPGEQSPPQAVRTWERRGAGPAALLKEGTPRLSLSGIIKCELIIQTAIDYKRMLTAAMGKVKRKLTLCVRDIKSLGKWDIHTGCNQGHANFICGAQPESPASFGGSKLSPEEPKRQVDPRRRGKQQQQQKKGK